MHARVLLVLALLARPVWAQQVARTEAPITGAAQALSWVTRTSDLSRSTNTTLTNDPVLQFEMVANKTYHFRLRVFFDTAASPDFKFALTGPASPTKVRVSRYHIVPGTTTIAGVAVDTAATASTAVAGSGSTGGYVQMDGLWQNGSNAGTFAFQWAQNGSSGNATTVLAGSQLEWMQAN